MTSKWSYISTQTPKPYIYDTVIDVFRKQVEKYPDKEIIIHCGIDGLRESLTYGELDAKAYKLAQYLIHKGIRKGDSVALFGPNTLEWVIGEIAVIMAGGIAVHVSMNTTDAKDLWELIHSANCKAILIEPGRAMECYNCASHLMSFVRKQGCSDSSKKVSESTCEPLVVLMRKVEGLSFLDFDSILEKHCSEDFPVLFPEDTCVVFTTSGTTGKPKMVPHSHFDALNVTLGETRDMTCRKVYNDRPFGWVGGTPILEVLSGQTRVSIDSSVGLTGNHTKAIWDIIRSEKCTDAMLYPYFLSDLLTRMADYDDDFRLQVLTTGGQIIDNKFVQLLGKFTDVLVVSYGSTEAAAISINGPIKTGDTFTHGDVGRPIPGCEVKIVDGDGNIVLRNEEGEVLVRSRMTFQGYHKNVEATKSVFTNDSWLHTGDTGLITEEGRLRISGRVGEMISRGTRKIMPIAIEQVILTMKSIAKVVVVGVPDQRLYEEVCVCFVSGTDMELTPDCVKEFCKEEFCTEGAMDGLGSLPTYFLKFDEFPLLSTGKTDRKMIKILACDRLGL